MLKKDSQKEELKPLEKFYVLKSDYDMITNKSKHKV